MSDHLLTELIDPADLSDFWQTLTRRTGVGRCMRPEGGRDAGAPVFLVLVRRGPILHRHKAGEQTNEQASKGAAQYLN